MLQVDTPDLCPFLGNYLVDLSSIWSKCLEGIVVVCDRVWQEVGVVSLFYVYCGFGLQRCQCASRGAHSSISFRNRFILLVKSSLKTST